MDIDCVSYWTFSFPWRLVLVSEPYGMSCFAFKRVSEFCPFICCTKKKRWNYPKYGFNYINVFDTQSNIFPVCGVHRTLYTPSHFHRINAKWFFGLFFLSRIFRTTLFDFVGHINLCGRPDPAPRPRIWHQPLKDRKEVDREHLFVCFLNSEDKRY